MNIGYSVSTKELTKRIANVKYTLLEQAQYQAMQSAVKPVRQLTKALWQGQMWVRKGKGIHRKAIVHGVTSKIKRPGGVNVMGIVGISRKNKGAMIVNILENDHKHVATGTVIPGRHVRQWTLPLAVKQAELFEAFIQRAALRMLSGK